MGARVRNSDDGPRKSVSSPMVWFELEYYFCVSSVIFFFILGGLSFWALLVPVTVDWPHVAVEPLQVYLWNWNFLTSVSEDLR